MILCVMTTSRAEVPILKRIFIVLICLGCIAVKYQNIFQEEEHFSQMGIPSPQGLMTPSSRLVELVRKVNCQVRAHILIR